MVSVLTDGFCKAAATLGGADVRGKLTPGSIAIVPAGITSTFECDLENEVALISISPQFLVEAAVAIGAEHTIRREIPIAFNVRDESVETTCKLLLLELAKPKHPLQQLIYDTTSQVFAVALLRSFNAPSCVRESASRVSARNLAAVLEYIDEHLTVSIRLSDLAADANASRFHFARAFTTSLGISPMAYVERSRLNRAKLFIQKGELTVTEIASLLGSADQSYFSRRFRRYTGQSPSSFRRQSFEPVLANLKAE